MRKSLRKVHIDGDEWRYVITGDTHGDVKSITLFPPPVNPLKSSREIIDIKEFAKFDLNMTDKKCQEFFSADHYPYQITPASVKKFIEFKYLKKGTKK